MRVLSVIALVLLSGCGIGVCAGNSACAPSAATYLSVAQRNSANILAWPAVAGATSYNVYWSTSPGVTKSSNKISGVTSPYTHSGLTNGIAYYYIVTALALGQESAVSQQTSGAPTAMEFMPFPQSGVGYVDFPATSASDVFATDTALYVATNRGLAITTDGGTTFSTRTFANGLGSNSVLKVYASSSHVFAATSAGLSISTDGGASFINKTTANGLGSNAVQGVYATGGKVYVAANGGGLSITP